MIRILQAAPSFMVLLAAGAAFAQDRAVDASNIACVAEHADEFIAAMDVEALIVLNACPKPPPYSSQDVIDGALNADPGQSDIPLASALVMSVEELRCLPDVVDSLRPAPGVEGFVVLPTPAC